MTEMTEMAKKIMNIVNSQQQNMEDALIKDGFPLDESTLVHANFFYKFATEGLSELGPEMESKYGYLAKWQKEAQQEQVQTFEWISVPLVVSARRGESRTDLPSTEE